MDGLGGNLSPRLLPSMPGLYSVSGMDILLFLEKVIHRPNPTVCVFCYGVFWSGKMILIQLHIQIHLGPVDLSCSFLISDATQQDCPIVYVSETFEKCVFFCGILCSMEYTNIPGITEQLDTQARKSLDKTVAFYRLQMVKLKRAP
jgi:hypothetical protein